MRRYSVLLLTLALVFGACSSAPQTIVIGSKNFTEQVLLGELLAQAIERTSDLSVDRRLNLGGTLICHEALAAGQLDVYVEYTGTALTAILKQPVVADPAQVYDIVRSTYRDRFKVEWTEPLGFNNTFAIVVRRADAEKFKLRTITDSAPYTKNWTAGFGYEFVEREDGYAGLVRAYNLQFPAPPRVMDLGLTYQALANNQVDFIAGNSTDGLIDSLNLVVLEDDKRYFPPYDAVPLVRLEVLERHPQLREILRSLGGKIDEEEMRRLNFMVDGEHRDVKDVVREFLDEQGL